MPVLYIEEARCLKVNAVLRVSCILVECRCQNQGPDTYDVKGALRKILGNKGYNFHNILASVTSLVTATFISLYCI
jgi:hypothetical protein